MARVSSLEQMDDRELASTIRLSLVDIQQASNLLKKRGWSVKVWIQNDDPNNSGAIIEKNMRL